MVKLFLHEVYQQNQENSEFIPTPKTPVYQ